MTRRRSKRKAAKPANSPSRPYAVGILIVHGVGNQRARSTVNLFTRRICETLAEVGVQAVASDVHPSPDCPPAKELTFKDGRPVLLAEGYWADMIRDLRRNGLRDVAARAGLVLAVLPFLLAAAVLPRSHELSSTSGTVPRSTWRSVVSPREFLRDFARDAPTAWRIITLLNVVLLTGLAARWLPWQVTVAALVASPFVIWVLLRWRWDVIEHIRMASLESDELEAVQARLTRDIDYIADLCEVVWVIGHSQGGYLAHRVLAQHARGRWRQVRRFTGLASGIRPISLVSTFRGPRWVVSGWLSLFGGVMMTAGMVWGLEPGGLLNTSGSRVMMQSMLLLIAQPLALLHAGQIADIVLANLMPTQWFAIPIVCVGFALAVAGSRVGHRAKRQLSAVPALPSRIFWEELASPSDIVGSMSVPEVPRSTTCRVLPSLRQPVVDHLMQSYFSRSSIFRFEVARWMTRGSGVESRFDELRTMTDDLTCLGERTYRLRLAVQAASIFLFVLMPVIMFGRSLFDATVSFTFWGFGIAVAIAAIAGLWWHVASNRQISRFVRGAQNGETFIPRPFSRRRRWATATSALASGVALLGSFGTLSYAGLVRHYASSEEVNVLVTGLGQSGGVMMIAAISGIASICLATVGLRSVRLLLFIAMLCCGCSVLILLGIGESWVALGAPGLAVSLVGTACTFVALVGNGRDRARAST